MIERLVGISVEHRGFVVGVTALLVVVAGAVAARLKLDALPDITTNQVLILTRAPGLTPEEVERRVTRPIEVAVGGLPGLVQQRSISRYGISSVTTVFDDAVDPYRARQVVQERLNTLSGSLPESAETPELGPLSGGLGEIFHFTLSSPSRTPAELYEMATFRVAPILRAVPGVVEVNSWGGERRSLEVIADPVRLSQLKIGFDDLAQALGRSTGSVAGASLPAGGGHALLRGVARPRDATDLGRAMVAGEAERPIRVADVAEVRQGGRPRIGAATANGRGEVVYVMAQMLRGANALEVMDAIHRRLPAIRAALPEGVRLDVVYDRSVLVRATLRTVGKNLLEGGLLVMVVLLALLGSLRAGMLVASAIPLSMLGAAAGMVGFDIPGNLMSLGAIDFGLIVDGSVVMVEHIFHELRSTPAGPAAGSMAQAVSGATRQVARPVFYSVAIISLVYVPVLSLTGADGKMFRPMALTVLFALVTSLVLSLTFIPAAASLVLRPHDVPARDPLLVRGIWRVYLPSLSWARRHPAPLTAASGALLLVGLLLFARTGTEFVPQLDEGDLVIQTTRSPDISLETAILEAGRLEAATETIPEVRQVVSRIGNPAVATDIMGIEQADVFLALAPRRRWRSGLTREELIREIDAAIRRASPGASPSFTQPIQMRFNELLAGATTDVAISIYGDDLRELRRVADELAALVRQQEGAADVRVTAPPAVSLIEVRPRPLDTSQAGFTVGAVLDAVQAIRNGLQVGTTWDGLVPLPIVLRLGEPPTAFTIADVPLPGRGGALVPLSRIAQVAIDETPSQVSHQDGERRLVVGFNVRGADLGRVVAEAQARVNAVLKLPAGYRVVWGGQYETLQEAARRLRVVVPLVLISILGVLLFAFRRWKPALMIFTNVPFASVGGMAALAMRGMPISMSAAIGFIALSGISVLNGVVLMSRVLANEASGMSPDEAADQAARARVRPVTMTALVAALGFVPMMLARGVGAEVQRPLATVVVGGLVTSTLLTVLILPTVYAWISRPSTRPPDW